MLFGGLEGGPCFGELPGFKPAEVSGLCSSGGFGVSGLLRLVKGLACSEVRSS